MAFETRVLLLLQPGNLDIEASEHNLAQNEQASALCASNMPRNGAIWCNLMGAQITLIWAILGTFSSLAKAYL
jgi:hypothetical protein